ncbi:MAG: hypothetical protein HKO65_01090, partial [Gemmatimonadetes bacterium]|nr:hypothetical protein [Gemmatimonadota bacterium]
MNLQIGRAGVPLRKSLPVLFFSVLAGAGFGLSYGWAGSNQIVYVPPGLRIVDPTFLQADWWFNNTIHYHWAYTWLVAGLERMGVLPWGLALGNVVAIAVSLGFAWIWTTRYSRGWNAYLPWALFLFLFAATDGFTSAAASYLFRAELQASSISTALTIGAFWWFVRGSEWKAGLSLGVAGIFHANFLPLNIGLFGVALALSHLRKGRLSARTLREMAGPGVRVLLPSLVIFLVSLPLFLEMALAEVPEATAELASYIFYDFALPHHYNPRTFLIWFLPLAAWHALGLLWLGPAMNGTEDRHRWRGLLLGMFGMIWVAAFFTTVLFSETVSRLFVWRLAPFSVWVCALVFIVGVTNRWAASVSSRGSLERGRVVGTGLAVLVLARFLAYRWGLVSLEASSQLLVPLLLLTLSGLLVLRKSRPPEAASTPSTKAATLAAVMLSTAALGLLAYNRSDEPEKLNLVALTEAERAEREAFDWIRSNTDPEAVFLIPPDLSNFRLFTGRGAVADLRTFPMTPVEIVEWYDRLQ